MNNEQEISSALQLRGRMQDIIRRGYALMADMKSTPSDAYAKTMAMVWSPEALTEMPTSLSIITQALQDIQTQCPALSAVIFPQQETTDDI
jgi:hypothetical protein